MRASNLKQGYSSQCSVSFKNCFKCLLNNIGATMMGVKPSELRNVRIYDSNNCDFWSRSKELLLSYNDIRILEIGEVNNNTKKVLFYHPSSLDKELSKESNLKFLKGIGYPDLYDLNSYLNHLKQRLLGDNFPHEIGIFFGYPLKDVLGFMGLIDIEVSHLGEWKFYGNKKISLIKEDKFNKAREDFSNRLEEVKDLNQFYEVI